jgi:hypothetical protein
MGKLAALATTGNSENRSVRLPVRLKVATAVRQIMKELSEAVSEEDEVMIITMMVLDLIQRNVC